jgi:hypothetical protein
MFYGKARLLSLEKTPKATEKVSAAFSYELIAVHLSEFS